MKVGIALLASLLLLAASELASAADCSCAHSVTPGPPSVLVILFALGVIGTTVSILAICLSHRIDLRIQRRKDREQIARATARVRRYD